MVGNFSILSREHTVNRLFYDLDLLVIGGGITGAGILLDAHTRGLRTGLIEMQDFAAGTSNRSTKLVHGGLRYLKNFEVGLVAEVGKERAVVYENGPHITTPVWMLLPIIKGGSYGKLASSIGIYMYDWLAGVKRSERRQMLSRDEALAKEPLLRRHGLKGAGYYVEYRTDDARLTLEILKEAVERGATAINYTKAVNLLYDKNGTVRGAAVRDLLTGEDYEIHAKKVVNATGPWVDLVRELDGSKAGMTIHHTKGVHIVIDGSRFPLKNAVYFDVPDGRMVFAIPRDGKTYIGTTDTHYTDDLVHPHVNDEDRKYLLDCVNYMFPSVQLTVEDVESSWAGVRPLIHEEGKAPSEISRKDEVIRSNTGLFTIAGGKLTGYRKMAAKVVDMVTQELGSESNRSFRECTTEQIPYSGGKFGGSQYLEDFLTEQTQIGARLGLTNESAYTLAHRYGTNVTKLFQIIRDRIDEANESGLTLDVFGALVYGIEEEMVATLSDFFIRRTGALYFNISWVEEWKEAAAGYMSKRLNWSEDDCSFNKEELESRIKESTSRNRVVEFC